MKLQDLKRGMKCTFRNGTNKIIDEVRIEPNRVEFLPNKQGTKATYFSFNEDLINEKNTELDILKVEDITLDGYVAIWEREEPKYYLRLPKDFIGVELMCSYYLNFNKLEKKHFFDTKLETTISQTQFTQVEIDKLDTTHLIKEEVE